MPVSNQPTSSAFPEVTFQQLESLIRNNFVSRFMHQTERGAALAVVAALDSALGDALKAWMIDDDEIKSQMFSEMGPLGSFGARVRLAYLLGMVGKKIYNDLITISRIRNTFAHNPEAKDFTFRRAKDLTAKLNTVERLDHAYLESNRPATIAPLLASMNMVPDFSKLEIRVFGVLHSGNYSDRREERSWARRP